MTNFIHATDDEGFRYVRCTVVLRDDYASSEPALMPLLDRRNTVVVALSAYDDAFEAACEEMSRSVGNKTHSTFRFAVEYSLASFTVDQLYIQNEGN